MPTHIRKILTYASFALNDSCIEDTWEVWNQSVVPVRNLAHRFQRRGFERDVYNPGMLTYISEFNSTDRTTSQKCRCWRSAAKVPGTTFPTKRCFLIFPRICTEIHAKLQIVTLHNFSGKKFLNIALGIQPIFSVLEGKRPFKRESSVDLTTSL